MAKGKLILICQSGGEFVKNDDGSLKYDGGEAQAVNVNYETLIDDLKLKLAEMCNLEYTTVSIRYFLPGNTRTLITLSSDKDLKRMLDFHGKSVTADVFITGREGFNRDALNIDNSRQNGIKVAESVNRIVAPTAVDTLSPVNASCPVSSPAASNTSAYYDSDNYSASPPSPVSVAAKATAHSLIEIDMSATPADTVKKRRRTASWKIGVNGPIIVAVPDDDEGDKRSRKKTSRSLMGDDEIGQKMGVVRGKDDLDTNSHLVNSDDLSFEKLVASWKEGISGIGQEFKNVKEFRDALQKYAVANRFAYKFKKNDNRRVSSRCVTEACSWRIHATLVPGGGESFRIKKFDSSHTCGGESWKSAHASKNWLVDIIKDRLRDSLHHKPKDIANVILRDFGIELSYSQVWRGIEDAREQLGGCSYKDAYNQLPWYHDKIMETNPGSFAKLVIGDDKRFRCLFISFHASIQGFQKGCRPLLFLEATSLKSKYQEFLLTATALDAEDNFFPVAFAIVDVENNDNWNWFLELLKSILPTSGSITFVSDREKKGLKESVLKVFENANYGYSMYHLLQSFKKSVKGPFHGDGKGFLLVNFVAAAHAVRLVGFKKFTEQIKQVSSEAYDWIMQIEPEYWTNMSFKGERYNQITENVAEPYIKLMEEARELPITKKIEALISMLTELINTRRTDSSKWSTKLTPSKMKKLHEEIVDARGLKALISSDTLFEVHDEGNHVVNLSNSQCTCLGWQTMGLPCRHAVAVFNRMLKSAYDYCSKQFTVDTYRLTYSESINPVPGVEKNEEKEGMTLHKNEEKEEASSDKMEEEKTASDKNEEKEETVSDKNEEKETASDKNEEKEETASDKNEEKEVCQETASDKNEEKEEIALDKNEENPNEEKEETALDKNEGKEETPSDKNEEKEKNSSDKNEQKEETGSHTVHVLPPCPSRLPSQPKPKEVKTNTRVVYCSRCKEAGHNKVTCKAAL